MDFETEKLDKIYRRSLDQFKDKTKIQAFLASFALEYEEVEAVFAALIILRNIDSAEGDALYKLGDMVGESYKGQSTEDYRLAIKTRIHANGLHSRAEDILSLYENYQMKDRKMKFSLRSEVAQTYEEAYAAWVYLQRIKGGAHRADYQYAGVSTSYHWRFDSNSKGSLFNVEDYLVPGSSCHFCAALNIEGYIWFVPQNGDYWLVLDPVTGDVETFSKSFSGSMAHAVYDGNYHIWAVPENSASVVKFNIVTRQETSYAHGISTAEKMYSYSVIDSTGTYLVGIPYNSDEILRVTLSSGSVSTITHPGTITCAKCKYAVVQGDYVYTVPYNASQIVRFKPSDMSYTGWSHSESGSALWQKAIIHNGYIFYTPYTAANFMQVQISTMSISKTAWFDKQVGDFMCGAFLVGDRLIHVPGKHDFWIEQDTQSNFDLVNKFRHPLPSDTVCAQYAEQHIDKSITGYGSNVDPYIIKFNPMDNSVYKAKVPFQDITDIFYNVAVRDDNENNSLFWGPENRKSVVKINWKGAFKPQLTTLVKLIDNVWEDGDCESFGTDYWEGAGSFSKDTTIKKFGSQSLKIVSVGALGYVQNTEELTVGEHYQFSFWFYTEDPNLDYLRIMNGGTEKYRTTIPLFVWKKINYNFIATDTILRIYPILSATTTFYIDHCRVTKIS